MGATYVTVAVVNPANPERRWEGLFLVQHRRNGITSTCLLHLGFAIRSREFRGWPPR